MRALLASPTSDFYEGVRAVLVDKGKGPPPAWAPAAAADARAVREIFDGGEPDEAEAPLRALGSHE
jgi:hypothetical protein